LKNCAVSKGTRFARGRRSNVTGWKVYDSVCVFLSHFPFGVAALGPGFFRCWCSLQSARTHPPVATEALVTEPGAVATGSKHSTRGIRVFSAGEIIDRGLNVGSGSYHHPTRAARAGVPVRSRFCNDSPTLRNGSNSMKLHHYRCLRGRVFFLHK
jgi:hypothetical protein